MARRRMKRKRVASRKPAATRRKLTRRKQRWISAKIKYLIREEGYPQKQAIAIAYSMAGVARNKAKKRKKGKRRAGRRGTFTARRGRRSSLWVYYKGAWSSGINKHVKNLDNEGSGCCTKGYADASFAVKSPARALIIAKKLAKVSGVGWTEVTTRSEDGDVVDTKTFRHKRKRSRS